MKEPLPAPARAISVASSAAVAAALASDAEAFAEATAELAAADPEQVRVVLGAIVRALLEDLHPDGFAAEDLQAALERCVRSAAPWAPRLDADVLIVVLTGALGIHDPEETPPFAPESVARHAVLLIADLLATSQRAFEPYLSAAFVSIAESELNEVP